jgi:hypothetical protein
MANLPEISEFTAGVYQIETTDPVLGGVDGITNVPLKALTNRTKFLKDRVDELEADIAGVVDESYVQGEIDKLSFKPPVRAASTTNMTLSGTQTVDGVALLVNDRILVKNQSTASQNGIYVVQSSAWTRAADMNADAEIRAGVAVIVTEGTSQAETLWVLTTDGTITIGSTALAFANIVNVQAASETVAGVVELATAAETTTGTDNTRAVHPAGLKVELDKKANLASPTFTGNPAAPTPAQFDADTSLATTAFVQQALGNARGIVGFTSNTSLTAAHAGMEIYASTSSGSITLSLPAANAMPAGAKFKIFNTGVDDVIVTRVGADTIVVSNTSNSVTAVTLKAGDSIILTSLGTGNLWYHGGGTGQLPYSGTFDQYIDDVTSISATVAANAMTITLQPRALKFRNPTLTSGAPVSAVISSPLTVTIPSGATLGTVNNVAARFVVVCYYNGGTPVLGVVNIAGGSQLDETNRVSPTTISGGATSNSTFYSASSVSANSPYRVVGFVDNTQTTAGTYAAAPSLVQGIGGQALAALSSLGYGQTWQNVTGSRAAATTYYNTTGKPITVKVVSGTSLGGVTVGGVVVTSGISANVITDTFVVPAGMSYSIVTLTGGFNWLELR